MRFELCTPGLNHGCTTQFFLRVKNDVLGKKQA
jgi:hypothetical protein